MLVSSRVRNTLSIAVACIAGLILVGVIVVKQYEGHAREYAIQALKDQFKADVTLGGFHLSLLPTPRATGDHLVVRFGGRTDVPPMIEVARFTIRAGVTGWLRQPMHVASVELDGLRVHVPPERSFHPAGKKSKNDFVADRVIADGAILEILPKDTGKDPLKFTAKRLRLSSAGGAVMAFDSELVNALPPGLIQSDGRVGPWSADDPGATPLSGSYKFANADLGVFKGIKGTLSSQGKYQGELAKIEVQGTADVPNFVLTLAGNPVHLRTTFAATVDGTNGDTNLHPVEATLGNSEFEVTGSIARGAIVHGREIDLSTRSVKGSMQDFLRLAVKGKEPPITGTLAYATKIKIPPGPGPNLGKLELDGQFKAGGVRFTSPDVQEKMASLSHRAEGEPREHDPDVTGSMAGRFVLKDGVMSLPQLAFDLPGARVNLAGTYTVATGAIDFKGTARLDAKVSQMTTGIKRVLLKPVDPLFEHDGAGAVVPIIIGGKRGDPSFRLDIGRAIKGH